MKKLLIIPMLFAFTMGMGQAVNNTLAQKRILYKDLQKRSNENTGYYKGKPFTGIVTICQALISSFLYL